MQVTRWKGESTRLVSAAGKWYKFWWNGFGGNADVGLMEEELADNSDSKVFVKAPYFDGLT